MVCVAGACGGEPAGRPNVVLITLESMRVDHVGCYEGRLPTTPTLDALAAEGVVYTDAHAVTSWTLASHASLFTGLYPTAHGATRPLSRLADGYETLAERLGAGGYQTAAVVSGPYLREQYGLQQGFEHYDTSPAAEDPRAAHGRVTSPEMEARMRAFILEERDPARPFFLFAYFWDPHYDYVPPAPYDQLYRPPNAEPIELNGYETSGVVNAAIRPAQLAWVLGHYDGEIRWTDRHLGSFFRLLKERDLWDDTLVIVTSDHGEEFFDHGGKGHKRNLYRESVQVPLIVKYPGGAQRGRDARLASGVDVMPTVLDVVRLAPGRTHGVSLLDEPDTERAIYFELDSIWYFSTPEAPTPTAKNERWLAVRRGTHKLIGVPAADRWELYDVARDPAEQHNVLGAQPELGAALQSLLGPWQDACRALAGTYGGGAWAEVDAEELEGLRSLGYVR